MKDLHHIWKYLRGECAGKAANRLEREALTDPFLYEALEGLTSVEADHEKIVAALQQQVEKRRQLPVRKIFRHWGKVACLLLLGGTALWFLYRPQSEQKIKLAVVRDIRQDTAGQSAPGKDTVVLADCRREEKMAVKTEAAPRYRLRALKRERKVRERIETEQEKAADTTVKEKKKAYGAAKPHRKLEGKPAAGVIKTVSGTVMDETGKPLPGAILTDGSLQALSDKDGRFRLNVPDTMRQLKVAFCGMREQTVKIPASGELRVRLKETPGDSSKGIVVGAGKERKPPVQMAAGRKKSKANLIRAGKSLEEWRKSFDRYVSDSLRYPEDAWKEGIEGEVQLSVGLNRKGRPGRIRVIKGLCRSCNREAIRLVEAYDGSWLPVADRRILLTIPFRLPVKK